VAVAKQPPSSAPPKNPTTTVAQPSQTKAITTTTSKKTPNEDDNNGEKSEHDHPDDAKRDAEGEDTTTRSAINNDDDTPNDASASDDGADSPIFGKLNPWQTHNPNTNTNGNGNDNATDYDNNGASTATTTNHNHLAQIIAEQEDERRQLEERIKNVEESTKRQQERQVSFAIDKEEEEMIRLAIEASLAVDVDLGGGGADVNSNTSGNGCLPLPSISTIDGTVVGQPAVAASVSESVGFGTMVCDDLEFDNTIDDDDDGMDEQMKLAMELSLQESRTARNVMIPETSAAASYSFISDDDDDKKMASSVSYDNDVNGMKPSHTNYKQDNGVDDDKKMASVPPLKPYNENHEETNTKPSHTTSVSVATVSQPPPPPPTATATSQHQPTRNNQTTIETEDEMIARALHEADDLQMAKSMKLAMQLQSEEDELREDERRRMAKCDNRGNVRTVGGMSLNQKSCHSPCSVVGIDPNGNCRMRTIMKNTTTNSNLRGRMV